MALAPDTLGIVDSTGTARTIPVRTDAAGNKMPVHSLQPVGIDTYSVAVPDYTPVATPTAMVVIQGSATRSVRIQRIRVGGAATAAGSMQVSLTKRTTAGTAGSAVLVAKTPAKHDSGSPAASLTVSTVATANYGTLGSSAGQVGAGRLTLVCIGSATTSGEGKPYTWEAPAGMAPISLRGTAEWLTIDGEGSALPAGAKLDVEVTFQEDDET